MSGKLTNEPFWTQIHFKSVQNFFKKNDLFVKQPAHWIFLSSRLFCNSWVLSEAYIILSIVLLFTKCGNQNSFAREIRLFIMGKV